MDLSQNGGGDDTAEAIARMLTDRTLHSARVQLMRTAGWTAHLTEHIDLLETAAASGTAPAQLAPLLERLKAARAFSPLSAVLTR